MGRRKKPKGSQLTELELQVILILWRIRSGTVHEVLALLKNESPKGLAYTTVSTVMRLLENRKLLQSFKNGRSHIYAPLIDQDEYVSRSLGFFLNRFFQGDPVRLMESLLKSGLCDEHQRHQIREILGAGEGV